jgi:hypothetical protein
VVVTLVEVILVEAISEEVVMTLVVVVIGKKNKGNSSYSFMKYIQIYTIIEMIN